MVSFLALCFHVLRQVNLQICPNPFKDRLQSNAISQFFCGSVQIPLDGSGFYFYKNGGRYGFLLGGRGVKKVTTGVIRAKIMVI
tara:strand:+ start:246 stop:497 length:252 start_codon:yes stop_codon:yes gene_type:complete